MKLWIGMMLTALVSSVVTSWLLQSPAVETMAEPADAQPLYWVAPMDANYRRDQPGKSPMGMDLVPVYADAADQSAGVITVSPEVVNSLGVRVTQAQMRLPTGRIQAPGYVQYDQSRLLHLHPRVEGWVEGLHVSAVGELVKKGQALYDFYSPALVSAQEEYVLALARQRPGLIQAAANRLRALQVSEQLLQQLADQRQVQQHVTFYASVSGVLDQLMVGEGMFVQPKDPLMVVADVSQVWVEAQVFARQAAQIMPGAPASMQLDYAPGKQWQGEVAYIYPALDALQRSLRVRLVFPNPDGVLKPNMLVQLQIQGDRESRLMVPRDAVIRTGDQDRVVIALGDGRFKSVAVTLGYMDEQGIEILSGLCEGDRVVTAAQFLLDSESSKSSDFLRWHYTDADAQSVMSGQELGQ